MSLPCGRAWCQATASAPVPAFHYNHARHDKLHITEGDSHSRQSVTNQTEQAKDLCEALRALLTVRLIGEGIPEIRIMNAV